MLDRINRWRRSRLAVNARLAPYRLRRSLTARLNRRDCIEGETLFSMTDPQHRREWLFHDERWSLVTDRFAQRRRLRQGLALSVNDHPQTPTEEVRFTDDGAIAFDVAAMSKDEWLYLNLDPRRYPWTDYSWSFTVRRDTPFRELQFGFRYVDFFNRYRYRFEDDFLNFDIVRNGTIHHSLSRVPFTWTIGRTYAVRIDAAGNRFRCFVDGALVSTDFDFANAFPRGPVAIIVWEDDGHTDIRGTVGDLRVHRLSRR